MNLSIVFFPDNWKLPKWHASIVHIGSNICWAFTQCWSLALRFVRQNSAFSSYFLRDKFRRKQLFASPTWVCESTTTSSNSTIFSQIVCRLTTPRPVASMPASISTRIILNKVSQFTSLNLHWLITTESLDNTYLHNLRTTAISQLSASLRIIFFCLTFNCPFRECQLLSLRTSVDQKQFSSKT